MTPANIIAAEKASPAASGATGPTRNYRHLAREILTATRRLDFGSNEERIICLVLEFSYLHHPGRDFAVFPEQNHMARLRGMSKTRISRTLDGIEVSKVIERTLGGIRFLPLPWKRDERNKRDPQAQLLLEDWLRSIGAQRTLNLFDSTLNDELMESWLQSGSSVAPSATGLVSPAVKPTNSVAPSATHRGPHLHDRNDHAPYIMNHAREGFLEKTFDVGALGKKTAGEILAKVTEVAPELTPDFRDGWRRRIGENARLVWFLACEAKERHDLRSKAAWLNGAYLREMGLKE